MRFLNRDIDISKEMTEAVILREGFAEIRLDWHMLPFDIREELVREYLDCEIEYDSQWFFISIIIPADGEGFDFKSTYFYIDELPPDEQIYKEIGNSLSEKGGDWLNSLDLSVRDVIQLVSDLTPGVNMSA